MKRLILFITLFLPFYLFGFDFKSISANYDVSYGVIGNIGKAKATIKLDSGTYKIRIEATGEGLVKFLSQDRVEVYESTGIVRDGQLVPTLFVKNKTWGSKEERKRYFFNHDKKIVSVIKTSVDGGKVNETREMLPYYAYNDILTLFFNLSGLIGKDLHPEKKQALFAVGANAKDGHLSVEAPEGARREAIAELLQTDRKLLIVLLNQRYFASKHGEFFINISKEGVCDRVVLKDVALYGDLVGKIKNLKIER